MRLLYRAATSVVNRNGVASPIYEQLLSSLVFLAQHNISLAAPALIQLTETGVAIAVRVGLPVLLPQRLLSYVRMGLPLLVKLGEAGSGRTAGRGYGGPPNRVASSRSSSQSSPSGHVTPAASARCKYS